MRIFNTTSISASVELSRDDLVILNNALNEACRGLDVQDFQTRMGAEKTDVVNLLHGISEVLTHMK